MKRIFLLIACLCCLNAIAQPARKALFGVYASQLTDSLMQRTGAKEKKGVHLDSVLSNGTAAALKLKKGDVITAWNGEPVNDLPGFTKATASLRTNETVRITYLRDGKIKTVEGKALMRPYEQSELFSIRYDWVPFRNGFLRCIMRSPKNKNHNPAILFIPGYNCGTIENYNTGAYAKLMQAWTDKGYAVMCIEKSGNGDSYNTVDCYDADLATDIASFEAGLRHLRKQPEADSSRIFLFGHSMGGVIAPELAKRVQVKGVMVYATVFRPWSEFLLEMHRVQNPLQAKDFVENEAFVRTMQQIYYEFFILKKTREELYQKAEYRALVESEMDYKPGGNDLMWGRHWRFWQQIDSLNLAESWKLSNTKVLSLFGGADWIACSEVEHYLITELVNSYCKDCAKHITIPDVDHLMVQNSSRKESVKHWGDRAYAASHFNHRIATETVKWMEGILLQE